MIELLMTSMLVWMGANCDIDRIHPKHDPCKLNYNISLPKVIFLPQKELKDKFYINGAQAVGSNERVDLYGFYIARKKTIYLEDLWSRNVTEDIVTLFHELYHHVEFENYRTERCISHREIPITMFQNKYVKSLGKRIRKSTYLYDAPCNVYYKEL